MDGAPHRGYSPHHRLCHYDFHSESDANAQHGKHIRRLSHDLGADWQVRYQHYRDRPERGRSLRGARNSAAGAEAKAFAKQSGLLEAADAWSLQRGSGLVGYRVLGIDQTTVQGHPAISVDSAYLMEPSVG